jgi:hypothetical protein
MQPFRAIIGLDVAARRLHGFLRSCPQIVLKIVNGLTVRFELF